MTGLLAAYGAGAAALAVAMLLAWFWQRRSNNAAIVDVVWTFGVGLLALAFTGVAHDGLVARRLLVAALVSLWSLRLGTHLAGRLRKPEDKRYQRLRAGWGASAPWRMLLFYQTQALAAPLFALPMLLAAQSTAPLSGWDAAGAALGLLALAGEWRADRQLARFSAAAENRGRVCDVGWWRYSRHPNYFFEWLHWCGYVPLAWFAEWGWLSALAPAAMFYFLNFVTGIPPAESQALESRGDAYRAYQQRTSPFFPWPPRHESRKR